MLHIILDIEPKEAQGRISWRALGVTSSKHDN